MGSIEPDRVASHHVSRGRIEFFQVDFLAVCIEARTEIPNLVSVGLDIDVPVA